MKIDLDTARGTLMVRISGEIDLAVADRLRSSIDQEWKKGKATKLVLDLSEVQFIDSSGLGVILGRYKLVTASGGRLYILRPRPVVERMLEVSGVKKIISICANEKEIFQNGHDMGILRR